LKHWQLIWHNITVFINTALRIWNLIILLRLTLHCLTPKMTELRSFEMLGTVIQQHGVTLQKMNCEGSCCLYEDTRVAVWLQGVGKYARIWVLTDSCYLKFQLGTPYI
jgi:hypothetical protein